MPNTHPTNPFARPEEPLALDARHLAAALALVPPSADAPGDREDPMKQVEVRDGVALVRVRGYLAGDDCWWYENYPAVCARMGAALASPQVRAVAMVIDSPGGTTSGLFDAMRKLRALRAATPAKRVIACVAQQATSAAYGLASTCDEIVVDEVAGVGSVGVIASLTSRAEELKVAGIDVRVVASGVEKTDGHPAVEITDAAEARVRERVMASAEILFNEVAAGRPSLTADALRSLEAGIRYGRAAVAAGLADRLGTLDSVLAGLAPAKPINPFAAPRATAAAVAASTTPKRTPMIETLAALLAAKTGETDPERQLGALQALLAKADAHDGLATELAALKSKTDTEAFEAEITAGLGARKITADEATWWREERAAGRASAASLNANLARRSAPTLAAAAPEHVATQQPKSEPQVAAQSGRVAQLLAKPYGTLTWDERNTLAALDPASHSRVHDAWVAAGRPKA